MAPVLYLDFDGCLHPEEVVRHPEKGIRLMRPGHTLFEHAPLLEQLLTPYPDLLIVLSTTWVRHLGYRRAASYLTPGLQRRVIGATYHRRMNQEAFLGLSRGMQVLADVGRRRPGGWLALDDDDEDWPEHVRDRLVRATSPAGLPGVSEQLREALQRLTVEVESEPSGGPRKVVHITDAQRATRPR